MPFIQTHRMPDDYDIEFEHTNYKLDLEYMCWFCGNLSSPKDEKHECLNQISNEESLANPYMSHSIEEIFKIALKCRSFSLDKVTLLRGEDDPLVAVVLSMIFGKHKDKRAEWLDRVPNVTPEIRQKMIDF